MSVLKPLLGKPLTFWFSGGTIFWRGENGAEVIDIRQVAPLLDVFDCEMRTASAADKPLQAMLYGELFIQLAKAREAHEAWTRATSGPLVPGFSIAGQVVAGIVGRLAQISGDPR